VLKGYVYRYSLSCPFNTKIVFVFFFLDYIIMLLYIIFFVFNAILYFSVLCIICDIFVYFLCTCDSISGPSVRPSVVDF